MNVNTYNTEPMLDARFRFTSDGAVELDTWSSPSRQHYIDTGEYLPVGEVEVDPFKGRILHDGTKICPWWFEVTPDRWVCADSWTEAYASLYHGDSFAEVLESFPDAKIVPA